MFPRNASGDLQAPGASLPDAARGCIRRDRRAVEVRVGVGERPGVGVAVESRGHEPRVQGVRRQGTTTRRLWRFRGSESSADPTFDFGRVSSPRNCRCLRGAPSVARHFARRAAAVERRPWTPGASIIYDKETGKGRTTHLGSWRRRSSRAGRILPRSDAPTPRLPRAVSQTQAVSPQSISSTRPRASGSRIRDKRCATMNIARDARSPRAYARERPRLEPTSFDEPRSPNAAHRHPRRAFTKDAYPSKERMEESSRSWARRTTRRSSPSTSTCASSTRRPSSDAGTRDIASSDWKSSTCVTLRCRRTGTRKNAFWLCTDPSYGCFRCTASSSTPFPRLASHLEHRSAVSSDCCGVRTFARARSRLAPLE